MNLVDLITVCVNMPQYNEVFPGSLCGLKNLEYNIHNLSKFKLLSSFSGALGTENRESDLCTSAKIFTDNKPENFNITIFETYLAIIQLVSQARPTSATKGRVW